MAEEPDTHPVPGYKGIYEVTASGRVFSLERRVRYMRGGKMCSTLVNAKELTPHIDRYGYAVVALYRDDQCWRVGLHRLICLSFHGKPPLPGMHAAHRDGVKLNNVPSNVRWATVAENNEDRRRHGVHPMGERLPHTKLTADKARAIVIRCSGGETDSALARDYGVSNTAIKKVRTGRSWNHVTGVTRTPALEAEIARLQGGVA